MSGPGALTDAYAQVAATIYGSRPDAGPTVLPGPTLADGIPHLFAEVVRDLPACRSCRGSGRRFHGWSVCPSTCQDCAGSGLGDHFEVTA